MQRPVLMCDTECYKNFWLIKFYDPYQPGLMLASFRMTEGSQLDRVTIAQIFRQYTIVTFNGVNYDEPMITLAMAGATCRQLKEANDLIIVGGLKWWDFYKHFELDRLTNFDHIDVKEVAVGVAVSLKIYGGRLNSKRLQDLPIKPSTVLTIEQMNQIDDYCTNDLVTLFDLYKKCIGAIELRITMSQQFGLDLRSKSDAQIAEAIIKSQLGFTPERAFWAHMTPFKYTAPAFIQFPGNPYMQGVLNTVHNATFYTSDVDQVEDELDENGNKIKTGVIMPPEIKNLQIQIGDTFYKMGIGGLHSMESGRYYIAGQHYRLIDADVTSYYPSLILICGMFPRQLGERFLQIYRAFYDKRLAAKDLVAQIKKVIKENGEYPEILKQLEDAQTETDVLKILLNGTYGKLGSKYSIMFAPDLMLQVTLTGQLSLLMLICMLESYGIKVVSANTDGVVMCCPHGYEDLRDQIIKYWEQCTGLNMEYTEYAALFSRDVNNYVAFKMDGTPKTKGFMAKAGIAKNPKNSICVAATIAYLQHGTPVRQTIEACTDVREFLSVRNVKGGAVKLSYKPLPVHATKEDLLAMAGYCVAMQGKLTRWYNPRDNKMLTTGAAYNKACEEVTTGDVVAYLGKAVRFYVGRNEKGVLAYQTNGNKVPDSVGAVPLMELDGSFPNDIDYDYYVEVANDMIRSLGVKI